MLRVPRQIAAMLLRCYWLKIGILGLRLSLGDKTLSYSITLAEVTDKNGGPRFQVLT